MTRLCVGHYIKFHFSPRGQKGASNQSGDNFSKSQRHIMSSLIEWSLYCTKYWSIKQVKSLLYKPRACHALFMAQILDLIWSRDQCWAACRCSTSRWTRPASPAGWAPSERTWPTWWYHPWAEPCSWRRSRCSTSCHWAAGTNSDRWSGRCRSHWSHPSWMDPPRRCDRSSRAPQCRSTCSADPAARPAWPSPGPASSGPWCDPKPAQPRPEPPVEQQWKIPSCSASCQLPVATVACSQRWLQYL